MGSDRDDETLLSARMRAAYVTEELPAGFAERVTEAWQRERSRTAPRRRRMGLPWWLGALTLVAASASLLLLRAPRRHEAAIRVGDREVTTRTTLPLGDRVTAVAEANSALSWTLTPDGTVRVQQRRGNVFYRAEKGSRLFVSTADADLTALGTCFRVEVRSMDKKAVIAALAATTFVSVYEGRVAFANERGRVEVAAGERAMGSPDRAPALVAPSDTTAVSDARHAVAPAPLPAPLPGAAPAAARPMPDTPDALFAEANQRLAARQWDEARRLFGAFLGLYPTDRRAARAQYGIGESYAGEKQLAEAIGAYTKVLQQYEDSDAAADAMYQNGVAFAALKHCSDAKVYLQALLSRYPSTSWKKDAEQRLHALAANQNDRSICRD